jgi:F0F1-type ATP synthase delta subunit
LQKNRTIKTFRFDTCSRLSRNTKELAWKAVESNPSLTQLHTNFEEEDHHLNLLTTFNRHPRWMQYWTDVATSADDRIRVIEEICLNSDSDQVVPFLFYLFQNFPEALRM